MPFRGVLCATAALTTAVASPAPAQDHAFAPFDFADMDFDPQCRPNAAFERVMAVLGGGSGRATAEAEVDTALLDAVSGHVSQRLRLERPVAWNGLQLVAIEHEHGIESGPSNYHLVFADPAEKVREVWNARGWTLAPVNQRREIAGLERYAQIMVGSRDDGTAVISCFRD